MILFHSHLKPSQAWKRLAAGGDNSFTVSAGEEGLSLPGSPISLLGLSAGESGTLLKISGCVLPHTDSYVGNLEGEIEGQTNLSLFWFMGHTNRSATPDTWLQCGAQTAQLHPGSFVIFSHEVMHAVISTSRWSGIAWQLASHRNVPHLDHLNDPSYSLEGLVTNSQAVEQFILNDPH